MISDNDLERLQDRLHAINYHLQNLYGHPQWRQHLPPIDELVSTILSQSTSDGNRDKGFFALKERYSDWHELLDAPVEDIIAAIRPAGLANQKGPRIQEALRFIIAERGELNIDFLADMPVDEARAWLVQIKGVGLKTASIILLFSFDRPAFPVDTHVHRISRRVGLVGPKVNADKAHYVMEMLGEPDTFYSLHLNLIQHGRQVCLARKPRCESCVLHEECDYFQELQSSD